MGQIQGWSSRVKRTTALALAYWPSDYVPRDALRAALLKGPRVKRDGDRRNPVTHSLSNALHEFEDKGWILRLSATTVRIIDRGALKEFVGDDGDRAPRLDA